MCDLKPLTRNCGDATPPGTRAVLYLAPAEEFTAWPQTLLQTTPATTVAGANKIYDDAFAFVATPGKGYWRKYDILVDSGLVNSNSVGEPGNLSFQNDVAFFLTGTTAERMDFAEKVANCCLVAMIQSREDEENMIVLGRNDDPAKVQEIKMTTGAKVGDKAGGAYIIKDSTGKTPFSYPITLGIDILPAT